MKYNEFSELKYFECLDFLRFISIALVIWHHTGSELMGHSPSNIAFGHYGVNMLFAISGFLITTLLLRERKKYGSISYPKFFMRRLLRIFPLYYLSLLIYSFLVYFFEKNPERANDFWNNIPYFITYTSNFFVDLKSYGTIFFFSWSLATEEQFYIFWPILMMLFSNRVGLFFMIGLVTLKVFIGLLPNQNDLTYVLAKIPYSICISSALAILMFWESSFNKVIKFFTFRNAPVLYLLLTFVIFFTGSAELNMTLPAVMSFLVISSIMTKDFTFRKIFTKEIFVSLGKVSYGMYLLHMICANIIKKTLVSFGLPINPVLYFILTTILTYGVSLFSFNTFERYFLNLKHKFAV